MQNRKWKKL